MATTSLDFTLLDTYAVTSLGVIDLSNYAVAPTNVSMEITPPGGWNKVNVVFTPRAVNIYTADHFNIACGLEPMPLPDGVYTMKYSVAPNATTWVEKSFMRIAQIVAKYERIFLSVDASCECNGTLRSRFKEQLRNIRLLIDGSVAAANQCDIISAMDMYTKAWSLLDKIKPCECN
jgi:hypothetical protein